MSHAPNLRLERSMALFERASARIPGGAQTTSKRPIQFAFGGYPIYAERASGACIVDVDGNEYIDLVQALGPIVLGYCHPAVDEAVAQQLTRGAIYGLLSPLEVECAERICELVPCAEMVRFFKGGGEATAAAARTVRAYTGRETILNCGYRGWPDVWSTDAGVPAGLRGSVQPFAEFDLDGLTQAFAQQPDGIAAVFLDILRHEPPPGYLAAVKELCHAHGALLVYDEIVTGFRLAPGGMQAHYGVAPDLACFAKAMANGLPLACVAGRGDVMRTVAERQISITYGGEALSLAAAVATMDVLRTEPVNEHLWRIGARLRDGLNRAAAAADIPFTCAGVDPLTTMAFTDTPPVTGPAPATGLTVPERAAAESAGQALLWEYFLQEMAVRGVLLRRGGCNFVTYSHTDEHVAQVVDAASAVFHQLHALWDTPAELAAAVQARKTDFRH